MRVIANKADHLIAMHVTQGQCLCPHHKHTDGGELMAATQAAMQRKVSLPAAKCTQQQQKGQGRWVDAHHGSKDQQGGLQTSMCFYHDKYGDQAKYCKEGCLWPEN
jgi:hypothetical protein